MCTCCRKKQKKPYYAIKYKRLAKRRGRKKAVIAIARMMLTSIYHMILNNEEWKPDDYEAIIHPSKPVKVALTLDNVIPSNCLEYWLETGT